MNINTLADDKKQLRKAILSKRTALSSVEVNTRSKQICKRIIQLLREDVYKNVHSICLYSPIRNEVDIMELAGYALEKGLTCYLPRVEGSNMEFYEYKEYVPLIEGAFRILEPDPILCEQLQKPDEHTLIIMPGAVFSEDGDRIGYGGGYYDKYLEKYPACLTIAVAYDFQKVPYIPTEETDIKPQRIIYDN